MLAAKSHVLSSDSSVQRQCGEPPMLWWLKRQTLRDAIHELGQDGVMCGNLLQLGDSDEKAVQAIVKRARDMSVLLSVDALEQKAKTVGNVAASAVSLVDTCVSLWIFHVHVCVCERVCIQDCGLCWSDMHTYIYLHTYIHGLCCSHIYTYIHTNMDYVAVMRESAAVSICICMHACMCVYVLPKYMPRHNYWSITDQFATGLNVCVSMCVYMYI
jgi:hypothetical protein